MLAPLVALSFGEGFRNSGAMYSTRPRKEKAKEERDIYGNTIDEEIELQGMSRERRAKHNREKLQQRLQAGSHVSRCLPVLELLKLRPDAAWFLNPVSADDVPASLPPLSWVPYVEPRSRRESTPSRHSI